MDFLVGFGTLHNQMLKKEINFFYGYEFCTRYSYAKILRNSISVDETWNVTSPRVYWLYYKTKLNYFIREM
jgi:hypothetical protein